jgi:myosin heavy subunit
MGILDPPGFDYVPRKNSFEQFFSNLMNEQMLFHYNQNVFSWEMASFAWLNFVLISLNEK